MSGFLFTYIWPRNQTFTVASAPAVTGSVLTQRFRLFFGHCILYSNTFITAFHRLFFIHLINHSFVCSFVCAFIHAVICHFVTIWKPEKNFFRSFSFITAKELNTVMLDLGEILTEDEVNNYTHCSEQNKSS